MITKTTREWWTSSGSIRCCARVRFVPMSRLGIVGSFCGALLCATLLGACSNGGSTGPTEDVCGQTIGMGDVGFGPWYVDLSKSKVQRFVMHKYQHTWLRVASSCDTGVDPTAITRGGSGITDEVKLKGGTVVAMLVSSGSGPSEKSFDIQVDRGTGWEKIQVTIFK